MRYVKSVVCQVLLALMNNLNRTETAIFPMQNMLHGGLTFLSVKLNTFTPDKKVTQLT